MKRNGMILLEFDKQPEGTHYRSGHRSWVPEGKATEYIEDGLATEHEPQPEPKPEPEPDIDYPEDFPEAIKNILVKGEIYTIDKVKELADEGELQSVEGIGDSTENKIKTYLGE